jgi:hypothetical protein
MYIDTFFEMGSGFNILSLPFTENILIHIISRYMIKIYMFKKSFNNLEFKMEGGREHSAIWLLGPVEIDVRFGYLAP